MVHVYLLSHRTAPLMQFFRKHICELTHVGPDRLTVQDSPEKNVWPHTCHLFIEYSLKLRTEMVV